MYYYLKAPTHEKQEETHTNVEERHRRSHHVSHKKKVHLVEQNGITPRRTMRIKPRVHMAVSPSKAVPGWVIGTLNFGEKLSHTLPKAVHDVSM